MNWNALALILAMVVMVSTACTTAPQRSDDALPEPPVTACAVPRPQACTMEYIPVCGHLYSGKRKTYANACAACSDPEVSGRHAGSCEEPDTEGEEPSDAGDQ